MTTQLNELERDVARARDQLGDDLATLRSADTYRDFVGSLQDTALQATNDAVGTVKAKANDTLTELLDSAMAKAAANPAAVIAIAGGLAWHFVRRPPIVAALVGGGLVSLLRTDASGEELSPQEYLDEAKSNLASQARRAGDVTGEAMSSAMQYAKDSAATAAEKIGEATGEMKAQVDRRLAGNPSDSPSKQSTLRHAGKLDLDSAMRKNTDTILLGVAALAVTGAFAAAFGRKLRGEASEERQL